MIAAFCRGKRCAEEAYNLLCFGCGHHEGNGGGTLDLLFGWKSVWKMVSRFRCHISDTNPRPHAQQGAQHTHGRQQQPQRPPQREVTFTPLDVCDLALSLSVMRSVAASSPRARHTLFSYSPSSSTYQTGADSHLSYSHFYSSQAEKCDIRCTASVLRT
jgi:hypothetical protein